MQVPHAAGWCIRADKLKRYCALARGAGESIGDVHQPGTRFAG